MLDKNRIDEIEIEPMLDKIESMLDKIESTLDGIKSKSMLDEIESMLQSLCAHHKYARDCHVTLLETT